ncbi:hypothetical protein [Streptomyces sp. C8S0]|uniref:hypothetical protein n=1 Tax=Streptomyces sp. C8S0 TaxID=2585716 RepID=UPI001D05A906|nr:hypothetical protein [Streptomyces sp. C8S0]
MLVAGVGLRSTAQAGGVAQDVAEDLLRVAELLTCALGRFGPGVGVVVGVDLQFRCGGPAQRVQVERAPGASPWMLRL